VSAKRSAYAKCLAASKSELIHSRVMPHAVDSQAAARLPEPAETPLCGIGFDPHELLAQQRLH